MISFEQLKKFVEKCGFVKGSDFVEYDEVIRSIGRDRVQISTGGFNLGKICRAAVDSGIDPGQIEVGDNGMGVTAVTVMGCEIGMSGYETRINECVDRVMRRLIRNK